MPQNNAYYVCIQRWGSRIVLRTDDIVSITYASVPTTSIGKWSFRGVSGRILQWWGQDLVFMDDEAGGPKRAAFWGNYAIDQVTTNSPATRVIVVETSSRGKLAFAFDDEAAIEECYTAFNNFLKSSRTSERDQRDEHHAHCLCELESFLFGMALGKPTFPPLQTDAPLALAEPTRPALDRPVDRPALDLPHRHSAEVLPRPAILDPPPPAVRMWRETSPGDWPPECISEHASEGIRQWEDRRLPPRRPSPQLTTTPSLHSDPQPRPVDRWQPTQRMENLGYR
eukprot:Protomagalhaensia_sp_Gyna_25__3490@NODE_313_length_3927_cov_9_116255_g244_i0_p2_GENE_NODE_313_length_3927_cov_9_116255_g244_i0NODE_313_length_3927_cov_9_116255_g244_i0_p2_ORF_typecomplete_len283_score28_52_NODE_313_length_3927_cov_9_116255_g244_i022393087